MALQERIDKLEEILDINEKCNDVSNVQETESKNNISKECPQAKVSKKDNQDTRNKDFTLNQAVKRKTQKV